jgi:hypothetical protein
MDAAKGATGHGWPFAPGLWSNDGAREPAAGGPDAWGKTSWLLLGRLPEVTRRKGETVISNNINAALKYPATAAAPQPHPYCQYPSGGAGNSPSSCRKPAPQWPQMS